MKSANVIDLKATSNGNIFYTYNGYGILKSTDEGISWQNRTVSSNYKVGKLTVDSEDLLYAASGPGILKSTDYGETWFSCYQYGYISSLAAGNDNILYAGQNTGGFLVSTDKGSTWISSFVTDKAINSITVLPDGKLFAATNGKGLFSSSDTGNTWMRVTDTVLDTMLYSTASCGGYIYVSSLDKVFRSGDNGINWEVIGTFPPGSDPPGVLNAYNDSTIYFLSAGIYRANDYGADWEFMYGPYMPNRFTSMVFSGNKIYLGTSYGVWRHNPDEQFHFGENYLPLAPGNKWQYLCLLSYGGTLNPTYEYSLKTYEISYDTLIGEKLYYKDNHGFIHYNKNEKKYYYLISGNPKVYLDFSLPPGNSYLQTTSSYKTRYALNYDNVNNIKGYLCDYQEFGFKYKIYSDFIENIGQSYLYESDYFIPNLNGQVWTESIIAAILYDSLGNPYHYTNNHKPQISLRDTVLVSSGPFSLDLKVGHYYSRIWQSMGVNNAYNFTDEVTLESFYQKGDSLITLPNVALTYKGLLEYLYISVLDTMLLKDSFIFNYRIKAIDKSILSEESYLPSEGYFQCVWSGPVGVDDLTELPFEFMLFQNYPNPFNPVTNIKFILPEKNNVQLKLFDLLGREIRILESGYLDAGVHNIEFNAAGLSSGMYIYQLVTESYTESKKMIILK